MQVDDRAWRTRHARGICSAGDVSKDCARATRCTVRQAGPTPWNSACWGQRTHCRRARVILALTRTRWVMGCWQHRKRVRVFPTLTAQVVVQQDRACATGSASAWGIPFGNAVGSRTRKVQEDLFVFVGQACDVRRQPHRARDRQVAQQSRSEQRHGRRQWVFDGA